MTEQPAAKKAAPTGPLSAQEQAYLGKLLARQAAHAPGGEPVQMKVEGDHAEFSYGGVTVGTEYTPVPASMAGALVDAAAEAGVTITQES